MKNEWQRMSTAATRPCRTWLPFGLALAFLTATACTPPATDQPGVEQTTATAVDAPPEVAVGQRSNLEMYLQRLEEPSLLEDCSGEFKSYRLLKLDIDQHIAAVRISWDEEELGSYRSVSSPSLDRSTSMDGWVGEQMWKRIEAEFRYADFWNLESERNVDRFNEPIMFIEGCANGDYHWVQRRLNDSWLAKLVQIFVLVGKVDWLKGNLAPTSTFLVDK